MTMFERYQLGENKCDYCHKQVVGNFSSILFNNEKGQLDVHNGHRDCIKEIEKKLLESNYKVIKVFLKDDVKLERGLRRKIPILEDSFFLNSRTSKTTEIDIDNNSPFIEHR